MTALSGLSPTVVGLVCGSAVYVAVLGKLLWRHVINRAPKAFTVLLSVTLIIIALIALRAHLALGMAILAAGFAMAVSSMTKLDKSMSDETSLWQAVAAGQLFLLGVAMMFVGSTIWSAAI